MAQKWCRYVVFGASYTWGSQRKVKVAFKGQMDAPHNSTNAQMERKGIDTSANTLEIAYEKGDFDTLNSAL